MPSVVGGGGGSVVVETDYPFGDVVRITARSAAAASAQGGAPAGGFALHVRVPGWVGAGGGSAALSVGGAPPIDVSRNNGTVMMVGRVPGGGGVLEARLEFRPALRIERWSAGGHSVHRGPLMYSLPLEVTNWTTTAHHYGTAGMSNDYAARTDRPWRFALAADASQPADSLAFVYSGLRDGAAPWNHSGWPVSVRASVRPLAGWNVTLNSASEPPPSPACAEAAACGAPQSVLLAPHGSTDLRIGMFPLA